MKSIQEETFFSLPLNSQIATFNKKAEKLTTEKAAIENELAALKVAALSGSVDELAGLTKKRDALKSRLLSCLIETAKLGEQRGSFQPQINEAFLAERQTREAALLNRTKEIETVFKEHGLASLFLQGVTLQTCQPLKGAVDAVRTVPKVLTEQDTAQMTALRNQIATMMA